MAQFCDYCEREFSPKINDLSARFCCEACRDNYHNTMRKIDRKKNSIYRLIGDLQVMRDKEVSEDIINEINTVLDAFNVAID